MSDRQGFYINFSKIVKVLLIVIVAWALVELDDEPLALQSLPLASVPSAITQRVSRILSKLSKSLWAANDQSKSLSKIVKKYELKRNYASKSAGARVVFKSEGINHANAVLDDSAAVLLFPCGLVSQSALSLIIDLSEDFYMEELLVVSKSLFAAYVKDFRVESALDYPTEQWTDLGFFKNSSKELFSLHKFKDSHLTRFVRLSIYSAHKDDGAFFCAINQIKIFGKTLSYLAKKRNEKIMKNEFKGKEEAKPQTELEASTKLANESGSSAAGKGQGSDLKELSVASDQCPNIGFKQIFEHMKGHLAGEAEPLDPYLELPTFFANNMAHLQQRIQSIEVLLSQGNCLKEKDKEVFVKKMSNKCEGGLLLQQNLSFKKRLEEVERKMQRSFSAKEALKLFKEMQSEQRQLERHVKQKMKKINKNQREDKEKIGEQMKDLAKNLKRLEMEQAFYYRLSLMLGLFVICCLVLIGSLVKRFNNIE